MNVHQPKVDLEKYQPRGINARRMKRIRMTGVKKGKGL